MLRTALAAAAAVTSLAAAAPALASSEPGVRVEDAAARIVVIPEARRDVSVTVRQGDPRLPPLRTRTEGQAIVVEGGLEHRIDGCGWGGFDITGIFSRDAERRNGHDPQAQKVMIRGIGAVALDRLPVITAHVPMDAAVAARGAVWGEVGPTASLKLAKAGCGDFKVADVKGAFDLSSAGSGDTFAGRAGRVHAALQGSGDLRTTGVDGGADLTIAGSGDVRLGRVGGGINASIKGSGDVRAQSAGGPLNAVIHGSGDMLIDGGRAPAVAVQIAGSGDFRFGGEAGSLAAQVAGSGDVHVAHVTGAVTKSVAGSGSVYAGR